jgi:S-formylglutathione hydrolase FrmB
VDTVLTGIPLVGWGPVIAIAAVAVVFLILAIITWRNHKVWRWVFVALFVAFLLGAGGDGANTYFKRYDTLADLLGIANYPTIDGNASGSNVTPQPNGGVIELPIPDTQSKFGNFPAKVWLPPQYFTDTRMLFPVVILAHGNPSDNNAWLQASNAGGSGLKVAQSGKPVILVMPQVLQDTTFGDSLCVDTASQGNAETYITKDVVAAVDNQLRTMPDAKHRGIGGMSMGGFCGLNLGLKHPDLFSVVLDFSGETKPIADTLPGGLQELFGANWQQQADANDPAKYYTTLNGSRGPAIWMDVGTGDTQILADMKALAPLLQSKGFTVEIHTRPGAHDFATWGNGLADALPWAAARFYSP